MTTPRVNLLSLLLLFVIGCQPSATPPANKPTADHPATNHSSKPAAGDAHSHGNGPHGGTVADWGGGKYHIEFVVDHSRQEATVYVLGGDAKTPAPIKATKLLLSINEPQFQVELDPQPLEGEAEGLASRFVGKHERLGKTQEFAGTISGEVDGKPYAGDFKE